MKIDGDQREWYFVLVEEWLVPTESGRDVIALTFDTLDEALDGARDHLERQKRDFESCTGLKCTPPEQYGNLMYIMTPAEGQDDEWYDCVKIVPITYGVAPVIGYEPEAPKMKG